MTALLTRIRWRLWESPTWFPEQPFLRLLCMLVGHEPIADQCNKPEHDYCITCGRSMPGLGQRKAGAV